MAHYFHPSYPTQPSSLYARRPKGDYYRPPYSILRRGDYYRPPYSILRRGDYYRPPYSLLRHGDYYRPVYPPRLSVMYHFQGRPLHTRDTVLTCRRWVNSPEGCKEVPSSCRYSHHDTGTMSPPLAYTCYFWSIGNCKFHKDDCLYAHSYNAMQPEAPRHFGYYRM